jgi:excisionase family DNA binding protein
MAHAAHLRAKARSLRIERKLTIDELAERLALSRSTVYYWVRDLPIPGSGSGGGWPESARAKAARTLRRKYRLLREEAYARGADEFDRLIAEPGFRDFVCLYIAEGYKRNRNCVAIGNSDAAVPRLSLAWIRRLTSKQISYSIQYHADQDIERLRSFWGAALHIDGSVIRLQRKSNSGRLSGRQWRSRDGVLSVTVMDTYLRARLQAWMDRVKDDWSSGLALNSPCNGT